MKEQKEKTLAHDILNSFKELKKEKIKEHAIKHVDEKKITFEKREDSISQNKKSKNNGKQLDSEENYLKITVDGVEILVRKDTQKIVIESDNIYVYRKGALE